MLAVLLWNVLHIAIGIATVPLGYGVFVLAFFGGVELVYVAPLAVHAWRTGRRRRMNGILYMWIIGVLLTAGVLYIGFSIMRGTNLR